MVNYHIPLKLTEKLAQVLGFDPPMSDPSIVFQSVLQIPVFWFSLASDSVSARKQQRERTVPVGSPER